MDDDVAHGQSGSEHASEHPGVSEHHAGPDHHTGSERHGGPTVGSLVEGPECQEALDTLYHFLDGELTDERRIQIQRHLDDCSPCLEAFDFEAELKVVIARRCRETVPETLRLRIAIALEDASVSFPGPEEGAQIHTNPEHHW
jgi:mycothiol system anti-sigma-R factor